MTKERNFSRIASYQPAKLTIHFHFEAFLCSHTPDLAAHVVRQRDMSRGAFTRRRSSKPCAQPCTTKVSCSGSSPRSQPTPIDVSPQCAASCTSNGAASTSKTSGSTAATPQRPHACQASQNAANSPAKPLSRSIPSHPPDQPQTNTGISAADSHAASKTRPGRSNK